MSSVRALVCTLTLAVGLGACSKSETPAASTAPAPAAAAATDSAPATAGVTGVPECDKFLSAYEVCVTEKMPEQARAQMKVGLEQWKTSWKNLAENSATRASLPQVCQQASDASKPALQAYGCTL